jgi:hypothetical protein
MHSMTESGMFNDQNVWCKTCSCHVQNYPNNAYITPNIHEIISVVWEEHS